MSQQPLVALDFETYFDDDYTLKKQPNFEYVTDPRFKANGLSVATEDEAYWVTHDDLPHFFREFGNFKGHRVLMQNAYFDGLICMHHYGCTPEFIIDTKGMANALVRPFTNSSSLDVVAKWYGREGKLDGGSILGRCKGMRDLPPELEKEMADYAIQDTLETLGIYHEMATQFPPKEYDVMNMHIQLYLRRRMRIDIDKLREIRERQRQEKAQVERKLKQAYPDVFDNPDEKLSTWELLRRDHVMADLIKREGALPPRKRSEKKNKLVYAFAKSDLAFQALRGKGGNLPLIVDAKALANSSIIENRLNRLELMHDRMGGWAHPLLNYYGAHTGRSSGGDKLNYQNLPKNPPDFRHIFVPPEGHKVVICDSGQIEARVVAYLAGQDDLIEDFRAADQLVREGKDPKKLGLDVYTKMAHKIGSNDRSLGKSTVLGCGFGMSEQKFVLNAMADPFMDASEEELRAAHAGWRKANPRIVEYWEKYEQAFRMCGIGGREVELGPLTFEPYRNGVIVWLPSGRFIMYGDVREVFGSLTCSRGKLWYGSLVENVVQAYARDVVFYQTLARPELLDRLWLLVHDEIDLVVHEDEVDELASCAREALSTPLEWCKDLPVIGEVTVADHLIKA
jgi:DNA polymerase